LALSEHHLTCVRILLFKEFQTINQFLLHFLRYPFCWVDDLLCRQLETKEAVSQGVYRAILFLTLTVFSNGKVSLPLASLQASLGLRYDDVFLILWQCLSEAVLEVVYRFLIGFEEGSQVLHLLGLHLCALFDGTNVIPQIFTIISLFIRLFSYLLLWFIFDLILSLGRVWDYLSLLISDLNVLTDLWLLLTHINNLKFGWFCLLQHQSHAFSRNLFLIVHYDPIVFYNSFILI